MSRWLIAGVLAIVLGIAAFFYFRPEQEPPREGDAETRIIAYLDEHVEPGKPVFVTELYNNVFTSPEERQALERLHGLFFRIPAAAAQLYMNTGKIPTLQELSNHFEFKIPGEMQVLLRVMDADPRVPRFFERDPDTGEIINIDVDRIRSDERFGEPLR